MRAERRVKLICLSLSIIAMATATLLHEPPRTRAGNPPTPAPPGAPDFPRNLDHLPDVLAAMNDFDPANWEEPGEESDDLVPSVQPRYVAYRRVALLSHGGIPFPQGPGVAPPAFRLPQPYERPDLARLTVWLDPYRSSDQKGAATATPLFSVPAALITRERSFEAIPALSIDGAEPDLPQVNAVNLPPPGDFQNIPEPASLVLVLLAAAFCPPRR